MVSAIMTLLGTAIVAVAGWGIRVGNRVSVLETQHVDLVTLINTRFDATDGRLKRIEVSLNGNLVKH